MRKTEGRVYLFSGAFFVLVNAVLLLLKVGPNIIFALAVIALVGAVGFGKFSNYNLSFRRFTDHQNYILKWCCYSVIMLGVGWFMISAATVPKITLQNGNIHMGGIFGGNFNVLDVQSVDTVSSYPRTGFKRSGSGFPGIRVGNYDMQSEKLPAKLCIYRNKPPYVKIRMNDNRLLLFNFNESHKTVAFYNQLQQDLTLSKKE